MKLGPHIDDARGDVLRCGCGCGFGSRIEDWHPLLFDVFEAVRSHCGLALAIISGCRCVKHNRTVKGEKKSQHLVGCAFDIAIPGGIPLLDFFRINEEEVQHVTMGQGGAGRYPPKGARRNPWAHMDLGWQLAAGRRWTR